MLNQQIIHTEIYINFYKLFLQHSDNGLTRKNAKTFSFVSTVLLLRIFHRINSSYNVAIRFRLQLNPLIQWFSTRYRKKAFLLAWQVFLSSILFIKNHCRHPKNFEVKNQRNQLINIQINNVSHRFLCIFRKPAKAKKYRILYLGENITTQYFYKANIKSEEMYVGLIDHICTSIPAYREIRLSRKKRIHRNYKPQEAERR